MTGAHLGLDMQSNVFSVEFLTHWTFDIFYVTMYINTCQCVLEMVTEGQSHLLIGTAGSMIFMCYNDLLTCIHVHYGSRSFRTQNSEMCLFNPFVLQRKQFM